MRCIFNIPVVGGFCAPTENPDTSCARHFSNEWTIPASGIFTKLGPVIEWSWCCRRCGAIGLGCGHRNRKAVMFTAFTFSFVAWLLMIFAACGMSTNPTVLKVASWAHGTVYMNSTGAEISCFIGLNGRVDIVDCTGSQFADICRTLMDGTKFEETDDNVYERFIAWDDPTSCMPIQTNGEVKLRLSSFLMEGSGTSNMCETCRDSATESVTFAIMGVFTQLPQMATDLQRLTAFGDVNCQATMGIVTSLWGLFSNLMSLSRFSRSCWRSFPTTLESYALVWKPSPAFLCLLIGSAMKLVDVLSHLVVPTPLVRRSKPPKEVKDVVEYMMLATSSGDVNVEIDRL
mmetsp:Transcript_1257/g.2907  ORF Transcript_1257/g.2907 Transcript_1257/m.2907 type:complete len:345 (+) Transcript_1257:123-1157(+)